MTDDQIHAFVARCQDLLGLSDWRIEVELLDERPEDREPGWLGNCTANPRYLNAFIRILRKRDASGLRETILHEVIHVAHAHICNAVDNSIVPLIREKHQEHASQLFDDALEYTTTRLARALLPLLKDAP